jgi:hypothetical protein
MQNTSEIIVYHLDENNTNIEVHVENETVWLSLNQISNLFNRDKSVISRHLRNIYKEGELSRTATVAKNATVQHEAGRAVNRNRRHECLYTVRGTITRTRGTIQSVNIFETFFKSLPPAEILDCG